MIDTRPQQRIQHSWEHYGKFVYDQFGKEAWLDWLDKTHRCYSYVETRPHTCTPLCLPKGGEV